MEQRELGKTGLRVGVIGFGTGYLYRQPQDAIVDLVREAIDHSVNYFDNWIPNPEARQALGIAFRGRRERIYLAGHLGVYMKGDQSDVTRDPTLARRYFDEMLSEMGIDHVDVLMLHNVDRMEDYERVINGGLLDCARDLQAQGKARLIGLSGHEADTGIRAAESGLIDVLMSPVGIAWQPEGVAEACAASGVGLIAMKPFWGGELLQEPYSSLVTPVNAISYALAQPAVATVVPGFSTKGELHASLAYLNATPNERNFAAAKAAHGSTPLGTCVYCGHCQPCTAGISVSDVMSILRSAQRGSPYAEDRYRGLKVGPETCTSCGECVERCPQRVDVVAQMAEAAGVFRRWRRG